MMKQTMNTIEIYSKILQVRTIFKKLQQLSWNISKLEQRYNIDEMSDQDLSSLLEAYSSYIPSIKIICDELKDEKPNNKPQSNT